MMEKTWPSPEELARHDGFWRWLAKAFGMPALLATPTRRGSGLPLSRLDGDMAQQLTALLGASGVRQDDAERAWHAGGGDLIDLLRRRLGDFSASPDAVVYPRHPDDVQALLKLCSEIGIAVAPFGGANSAVAVERGSHKAVVALKLEGLGRILNLDLVSGLVEAEAGITGAELERQLGAHGMSLTCPFEGSLGGWLATAKEREAPHSLKLATSQGMLSLDRRWAHLVMGSRGSFGVITAARLPIRARIAGEDHRAWLFRDFAAGLTALREAMRSGLAVSGRLCDDGATRFEHALQPHSLRRRLWDAWFSFRGFDGAAVRLTLAFAGRQQARQRFAALAKKLGAQDLGPVPATEMPDIRPTLLDRGAALDQLTLWASWAELPLLYVRLRAALKQAMRAHAPLAGAHGLVLAHIGSAGADGASLRMSWVYPRKLDEEIAQASSIRQAALAAARRNAPILERQLRAAIKRCLDPAAILPPEA